MKVIDICGNMLYNELAELMQIIVSMNILLTIR